VSDTELVQAKRGNGGGTFVVKEHRNVRRDIENMAKELSLSFE